MSSRRQPGTGGATGARGDIRDAPRRDLLEGRAPYALCGLPRDGEIVVLTTQVRRDVVVSALRFVAPNHALGIRTVDDLATAKEFFDDARFAAEVAATVTSFEGLADWSELGVYASCSSQ